MRSHASAGTAIPLNRPSSVGTSWPFAQDELASTEERGDQHGFLYLRRAVLARVVNRFDVDAWEHQSSISTSNPISDAFGGETATT